MFGALLSRKFIISFAGVIMLYSLVWAGRIDAKEFTTFLTWIIGIYTTTNVVQKATEKTE